MKIIYDKNVSRNMTPLRGNCIVCDAITHNYTQFEFSKIIAAKVDFKTFMEEKIIDNFKDNSSTSKLTILNIFICYECQDGVTKYICGRPGFRCTHTESCLLCILKNIRYVKFGVKLL